MTQIHPYTFNKIVIIFKVTHITYVTHIAYIPHTVKLIFKVCKKLIKRFSIMLSPIYLNVNRILSKKQIKTFKKGSLKNQNLSKKEKNKKRQFARERYRDLSEE